MDPPVHGFIQLASLKANGLKFKVSKNETRGHVIWIYTQQDGWIELGALWRTEHVELLLSALLPTTE